MSELSFPCDKPYLPTTYGGMPVRSLCMKGVNTRKGTARFKPIMTVVNSLKLDKITHIPFSLSQASRPRHTTSRYGQYPAPHTNPSSHVLARNPLVLALQTAKPLALQKASTFARRPKSRRRQSKAWLNNGRCPKVTRAHRTCWTSRRNVLSDNEFWK